MESGGLWSYQTFEEYILRSPTVCHVFIQWCEQNKCSESILFWREIESFRSIPSPEYAEHLANKIYSKYVAPTARQHIDPAEKCAAAVRLKLANNPPRNIFDEIATSVKLQLGHEHVPGFWGSTVGKGAAEVHPLKSVRIKDSAAASCVAGVDELMRFAPLRIAFRRFLDSEGCSTHVLRLGFLQEVAMYRALPSRHHIATQARKIYARFLAADPGRQEVMVPANIVQRVRAALCDPYPELFTEAQLSVGCSMHVELLPLFRRSKEFAQLLRSALQTFPNNASGKCPENSTHANPPLSLLPRATSPAKTFDNRGVVSSETRSLRQRMGLSGRNLRLLISPSKGDDVQFVKNDDRSSPRWKNSPLGRGALYMRSRKLLGPSPRRRGKDAEQLGANFADIEDTRKVLSSRVEAALNAHSWSAELSTEQPTERPARAIPKHLTLQQLDELYAQEDGNDERVLKAIESGRLVKLEHSLCPLYVIRGAVVSMHPPNSTLRVCPD